MSVAGTVDIIIIQKTEERREFSGSVHSPEERHFDCSSKRLLKVIQRGMTCLLVVA